MSCSRKINEFTQKSHYDQFLKLKTWTEKTLQLRTIVKRKPLNDLNPIIRSKKYSCKYFLCDSNGVEHQVCLEFVAKCLRISKSLKIVSKYKDKNPIVDELRGKFPTRKYPDREINFAKNFIRSIPAYESHYKISNTNKKYLSPELNICRIYKEYNLKRALLSSRRLTCRELWTFHLFQRAGNFIYASYNEVMKKGYMHVWDESIAHRESQEIFSCLRKKFSCQFFTDQTTNSK